MTSFGCAISSPHSSPISIVSFICNLCGFWSSLNLNIGNPEIWNWNLNIGNLSLNIGNLSLNIGNLFLIGFFWEGEGIPPPLAMVCPPCKSYLCKTLWPLSPLAKFWKKPACYYLVVIKCTTEMLNPIVQHIDLFVLLNFKWLGHCKES